MSKIDRHSDLTPSPLPKEQRILMRALGCGVEELVARFGDQTHQNRIATRQARPLTKAPHVLERRSRQDRDGDDEQRNTKPARSARHVAMPGNDARAQD